MKYSTLHRHVDPQGVSRALEVFDTALARLRENPPRVFVLENTASLLALPETLAHIDASLSTLPYDWRCDVTPPAPPSLLPASHPPPPNQPSTSCDDRAESRLSLHTGHKTPPERNAPHGSRCTVVCPHADFGADITRPRLWWVGYRRTA